MSQSARFLSIGTAIVLSACVDAGDGPTGGSTVESPPPVQPSPCASASATRQAFFGDLHVHTVYSLDANTQGTRLDPHQAYRFARGERLGIQPYDEDGNALREHQLARPLDFAAVTDHVELFGETEICTNPDYLEYNAPECQFYRESPQNAFTAFNFWALGQPDSGANTPNTGVPEIDTIPAVGSDGSVPRMPYCGPQGATCLEAAKTPWRDVQLAAANFNDPDGNCEFTTFVAYEWTGSPQSNNLHRNVIFRSDAVPESPPAYPEYPHPELLWNRLAEQCQTQDNCDWLTIPHNSNLSAGLMFETTDKDGNPYGPEVVAERQQAEPLAEIYQHKGQSECLNTMGAGMADELCGFELIPYNNLTGDRFGGANTGPPMEQDFLREALKLGLELERDLGTNPFKFGLIGSSDTHLGTPGLVTELDFPGHGGAGKPAIDEVPPGLSDLIENSPGGLAVLWAEENSRDSLYEALRRREVYATTGNRPVVRFFAGWELPDSHCQSPDYAQVGYDTGVPMGADLPPAPDTTARPRFSVSALRDPGIDGEAAEPLQRIQIIKGWLDGDQRHERVLDVAGDANNGAGVDLSSCATSGPGFSSLCAVWEDADFDPDQSAFYYARVVDNPSCRWSHRQCLAAAIDCSDPDTVPPDFAECCDARFPPTIQERAWTSPIWYRPPGT